MPPNTLKCNHLTPVGLKGLNAFDSASLVPVAVFVVRVIRIDKLVAWVVITIADQWWRATSRPSMITPQRPLAAVTLTSRHAQRKLATRMRTGISAGVAEEGDAVDDVGQIGRSAAVRTSTCQSVSAGRSRVTGDGRARYTST